MCQLGNYFKNFVLKLNSGGQNKRENKRMNKNVKFGSKKMERKKGYFFSFFDCRNHTHTPGVKGYGFH